MSKLYINIKNNGEVETIDEFNNNSMNDLKYARKMRDEYNYGNSSNYYYLSTRSTKDWRNS